MGGSSALNLRRRNNPEGSMGFLSKIKMFLKGISPTAELEFLGKGRVVRADSDQENQRGRSPELKMANYPVWWHHHGTKFRLHKHDSKLVYLSASAAQVMIRYQETPPLLQAIGTLMKRHGADPSLGKEKLLYRVEWEIQHSRSGSTSGIVEVERPILYAMFGIQDSVEGASGEISQWLLYDYGGTCACQGSFIRWNNYLNIPGPGIGHDGDPNVSIELDDEIREAIKGLR